MFLSNPTRIAIVGGGCSGVMVAIHLLRNATICLEIILIERQSQLGQGIAYGTTWDCHLLNVPAGKMSAFPDDPDHFLRWLQKEDVSPVDRSTFVKRSLYGRYLQATLLEAQTQSIARLQRIQDEAIALNIDGGTYLVLNNGIIQADKIVLAIGNFPPKNLPAVASLSPSHYVQAWSSEALTSLPPDESVLLIGSGMTAIDIVSALHHQGHQGKIYLISRRGLLPKTHQTVVPYPSLTIENIERPTIRAYLRWLRQEVQTATLQGYDWRAVIDALRPNIQHLWQRLPLQEQRRFLRHLQPYWDIHRHRLAPEIGQLIQDLQHQLIVYSGRIDDCQENENGVLVKVKRKQLEEIRLQIGRVINCTGPNCNYYQLSHPLILNLRALDLIQPDEMGLKVAPNGALLNFEGVASSFLYTLGSPRKGQLWETTAAAEICQQAIALSTELLLSNAQKSVPLTH